MTFEQWLKTECGKKCAEYPITGGSQYLRNRLWWAFDAGRQEARDKMMTESALKAMPADTATEGKP